MGLLAVTYLLYFVPIGVLSRLRGQVWCRRTNRAPRRDIPSSKKAQKRLCLQELIPSLQSTILLVRYSHDLWRNVCATDMWWFMQSWNTLGFLIYPLRCLSFYRFDYIHVDLSWRTPCFFCCWSPKPRRCERLLVYPTSLQFRSMPKCQSKEPKVHLHWPGSAENKCKLNAQMLEGCLQECIR